MSLNVSTQSNVVAAKNQICSDLAGETVILQLTSGVYYGLDAVGTWIWNQIQVPRPVYAIRDALLAEYEVDVQQCEQDLLDLLRHLAQVGLIEVADGTAV
jgi:hypothetical protein